MTKIYLFEICNIDYSYTFFVHFYENELYVYSKKNMNNEMDLLTRGKQALSAGEWERAKDLLEKAAALEESPEVFENLAWAYWWLNNASTVFEYRSKAYQLYLNKNDFQGAARNAAWIGLDYLEFKNDFAIANGWFLRCENLLVGLENTPEFSFIKLLKARLAFMIDQNTDAALKLVQESLELSKSLNYIEGEMLAEALKGFILVAEGRISEGMPLLDEATLLATTSDTNDINTITITCCFLIDACERIRDYERAGQWCIEVREICKRWQYKVMFAACRTQYAAVLIWQGEWKEAEEELLSAATELKEFRPAQVNSSLVRLADLRRRQGRWNEAAMLFDEVESHWLKSLGCAALYFDQGDYGNALNLAERFVRQIPDKEKTKRIAGLELLVRIYVKLNKPDLAQKVYNELKDIADLVRTLPLKAALLSAWGNINSVFEEYQIAKQSLEDAADIYDKIKAPFESCRTRFVLAEVLIKTGNISQAETELYTILQVTRGLGAEKDFEKAKNLLKNLNKNKILYEASESCDFTGREIEILRLIAEGKNNEEIAGKLFLSIRTVEKHITNIYQKLGISGKSARAFAASYAIKNKLVTS